MEKRVPQSDDATTAWVLDVLERSKSSSDRCIRAVTRICRINTRFCRINAVSRVKYISYRTEGVYRHEIHIVSICRIDMRICRIDTRICRIDTRICRIDTRICRIRVWICAVSTRGSVVFCMRSVVSTRGSVVFCMRSVLYRMVFHGVLYLSSKKEVGISMQPVSNRQVSVGGALDKSVRACVPVRVGDEAGGVWVVGNGRFRRWWTSQSGPQPRGPILS